jgi:putative transposase
MEYLKNQRRSIRLFDYDYSQSGAYFITICIKDKKCLLGKIIDNNTALSDIGKIINQYWIEIPNQFLYILLDEFTVMPNHLHGIIIINNSKVGVQFIEQSG